MCSIYTVHHIRSHYAKHIYAQLNEVNGKPLNIQPYKLQNIPPTVLHNYIAEV